MGSGKNRKTEHKAVKTEHDSPKTSRGEAVKPGRDAAKTEREAVLDILLEVLEKGRFLGDALDRELKLSPRSAESRAFVTRLAEGTVERLVTIDDAIDSCASVKVRKMKPAIRNILRESVYQMLFMDNVADAAAVNEAVTLAKKRGFEGLAKFVNGVLRTVGRKKASFSYYTGKERGQEETSVYYSVPDWLVRHMENAVGKDRAEAVFGDFLTVRPLQARINRSNADKNTAVASLTSEGLSVSEHPYLDNVICLKSAPHLTRLEAFREGWIQIQDASSVLAVAAAGIAPGMRVLDVCAAPGGKSLYAADLGAAVVRARDLTDTKVKKISENASRCHFEDIIRPETSDARIFDPSLEAWADAVIADLPCSGLGVIAKKPDIKYRVQPEDLKSLAALQREILTVAWRYVKPGGVLIYSTCTVSPEENQENVRWFLSQDYPMEADDMSPYLPERLWENIGKREFATEKNDTKKADPAKTAPGKTDSEKTYPAKIEPERVSRKKLTELQLLPGEYETDGFFIARFRRTPEQEYDEK